MFMKLPRSIFELKKFDEAIRSYQENNPKWAYASSTKVSGLNRVKWIILLNFFDYKTKNINSFS